MSLDQIVLAEGMRADLCALLDYATLLDLWPTLRTLIAAPVREVWEDAFAELHETARTGTRQPAPRGAPVGLAYRRRLILPDLHARLLADVLALGAPYPLTPLAPYAPRLSGRHRPGAEKLLQASGLLLLRGAADPRDAHLTLKAPGVRRLDAKTPF